MPRTRTPKLIRPACIVGSSWLLCVALFFIQYSIPLDKTVRDMTVSAMFLIALFVVLPGTILLLVAWLHYIFPKRAANIAVYSLFVATVYGIGWLINEMLDQPIAYLPLRLVLLVHSIVLLWLLTSALTVAISLGFARLYRRLFAREAGQLTLYLATVLGLLLTGLLIGQCPPLVRLFNLVLIF